jgi:hypothetical protein
METLLLYEGSGFMYWIESEVHLGMTEVCNSRSYVVLVLRAAEWKLGMSDAKVPGLMRQALLAGGRTILLWSYGSVMCNLCILDNPRTCSFSICSSSWGWTFAWASASLQCLGKQTTV